MSFIGILQSFVGTVAPWFVRNKNVGTLLESAAFVQDAATESLVQGLKLSQPLNCDSSALPYLSRDRGITLYPTEPIASQRVRLSQWWQLHRQGGTHQGGLRNLAPYFLPVQPLMRIVHQDGNGARATWHTLGTDGAYTIHKAEPSNWNWDGVPLRWSRWWAIIYRDPMMAWLDPAQYDDGTTYDDGTLWDGGPSTAQGADIIAALKERQGPHSMLWGVAVTRDASSFDPTATAVVDGDGWSSLPTGNWGSVVDHTTGLPTRPPYASWIYDKGQAAPV